MSTPASEWLVGARDLDLDDLADESARARGVDVDDLASLRAPLHAVAREVALLALARALDEHLLPRPDEAREVRRAELVGELEEAREPLALHLFRHVVAEPQRRGVRPRRVLEAEERHEADLAHERERLREVVLRLAREADDDVGRQREPRPRARQPLGARDVLGAGVAADHPAQHPVAPRLHRQVHVAREDVELRVGAASEAVAWRGCGLV